MSTLDEVGLAKARQAQAAGQRYQETGAEREAIRRRQETEGLAVVDSVEQLEARASRLIRKGEVPVEAVLDVAGAGSAERPALLERIIGATKDLQAASFLSRGARAAATVGRISLTEQGRELPLGTGLLVSPGLLMTNNHVLPDVDVAARVVIEFGAEVDIDNVPLVPTRLRLDPGAFFVTDEHLDYALVLVRPGADGRRPGEVFGWNRLVAQQGKIVTGEAVNIVGHPMGRLKEISVRNNTLELQLEHFLHYSTDTEPGNSGSPVFNDQWEVVALHHSGVPRTDAEGRYLRRDGRVWERGDGEDAIDWMANEGARVSVILAHLARLVADDEQRAVLSEMGPESGLGGRGLLAAPVPALPEVTGPAVRRIETAGVRRGLSGRPTAFGGVRHLLFLHGRGQEGRDPEGLRRSWTGALNLGLTLAGRASIDSNDAWLPFYGDRIAEILRTRETVVSFDELVADPAEAVAPSALSARMVYEQIVAEAAAKAGMPADEPAVEERFGPFGGLPGRLRGPLGWLAARSGLDKLLIAQVFRDVASYLDDAQVRGAVLDCVLETVPASGELILVSHSLGTVIAVDLMTKLPAELDVTVLVTAGSPLGLDTVYDRLLVKGPKRPARVGRWLNAWSPADPVAIGCPLRDDWRGQLDEITVDNPKERAHNMTEYLTHAAVARRIRDALE